jgi:hypothetical protein
LHGAAESAYGEQRIECQCLRFLTTNSSKKKFKLQINYCWSRLNTLGEKREREQLSGSRHQQLYQDSLGSYPLESKKQAVALPPTLQKYTIMNPIRYLRSFKSECVYYMHMLSADPWRRIPQEKPNLRSFNIECAHCIYIHIYSVDSRRRIPQERLHTVSFSSIYS